MSDQPESGSNADTSSTSSRRNDSSDSAEDSAKAKKGKSRHGTDDKRLATGSSSGSYSPKSLRDRDATGYSVPPAVSQMLGKQFQGGLNQAMGAGLNQAMGASLTGLNQTYAASFSGLNLSGMFGEQHRQLLVQIAPRFKDAAKTLPSSKARQARQEKQQTTLRTARTPRDFLTAHAAEVANLREYTQAIATISNKQADHEPVWRGQSDASWPVRSTLYRAVTNDDANLVATEDELVAAETDILESANRWGLHPFELAIPPMQMLAELQHAGAPTRLLDVTLDLHVATWFAVENEEFDHQDGLIVGWGQRLRIKRGQVSDKPSREFDDLSERLPWSEWTTEQRYDRGWGTGAHPYVWFPTRTNNRMKVQRAGFMLDAGPLLSHKTVDTINKRLSASTEIEHRWELSELERTTSVFGIPSPIRRATTPNTAALVPIFTILIKAEAKHDIRNFLQTRGLESRSMYPDLDGLVQALRRKYS